MTEAFCGLDFGTSNSTIGLARDGAARLARVEGDKVTIPSALFFSLEDKQTYFGRQAVAEYIDGADGRLMRALKSILGSSLMLESTQIAGRRIAFTEVLGIFLRHLKDCVEREAGVPVSKVVLGRPVHFVDDDKEADMRAQGQLEAAARAQGFTDIAFQFEPLAAALDYEQQVDCEQLALIVDIGGGTSDFSIVRVSPERAKAVERGQDILANTGVHVGGTDFDRLLNMTKVMPHLGYGTMDASGKYDLPAAYYTDLATWQRINWLYNLKTLKELRQVQYAAMYPEMVERLIAVIEQRQGHRLAGKVEEVKIALTQGATARLAMDLGGVPLALDVTRADFDAAIEEAVDRVVATVQVTLSQAGLRAEEIQAVFLTGGSSQIPLLKAGILTMFPTAKVVKGDMFGSVGMGLALDAARKFG